ncbi:MAG: GEVED domain-containing protein, partial [Bacteroidia bacterium]|nr:GEVED domain-containing protein [Bacteroidia bacterium]
MIYGKTFARESNQTKSSLQQPWQAKVNKGEMQELVNKRNRFAKNFLNADGTMTMFTSPKPQHFLSGGVWKDIDISIKPSSHNGFAFANEENSFKSYYPNIYNSPIKTKIAEGEMFEKVNALYITDNNDAVLKSFNGNNQAIGIIDDNKITYKNYLQGVDIRYSIRNEGRKFDLILNSNQTLSNLPQGAKYFVIEEKVQIPNNWLIKHGEDGIDFFSNSTWLANIPTPLAFETQSQNKKYETDQDLMTEGKISYKLIGNELIIKTKYEISWLKNPSRIYPINLDPVVNFYPQNVANSTGYQTTAAGKSSGYIRITNTNTNLGWASFDITTLPAGATIATANYWGYHYTTAGDKYANIVGLQTVLPIPSSGTQLNTQIISGPVYTTNYLFGSATLNTWRVGAINPTGCTAIAAEQAQGATGLGFIYTSGLTTFQYQYGYNGTYIPYLELNYSQFPCAGQPTAGTATSSVAMACGTSFNLNLTGYTNAGSLSFQWQSSPAGQNTWTNLGAAQLGALKSTTQAIATDYRCIVTCTVSGLSDTSTVVSVGQNPPTNCYCIPFTGANTYYISNCSTTGGITNFTNNGTGPGITPGNYGYSNYSATYSTSQIIGGTVNLTASGNSTFGWRVYVDWNQDGDFLDANELIYQTASYVGNITCTITVPVGAAPGLTRMRVYQDYLNATGATGPCGPYAGSSSETEDYGFMVIANCTNANGGTATPSSLAICEGNTATFSSNAVPYQNATFQWKVSNTPGGPYTNVIGGTGANTATYTTANNLPGGTYYFILEQTCAACGPCSANSNEVTLTVNSTPAPSGTNSVQCNPGIPTCSVSSNAGVGGTGQFTWWSAANGGTILQYPPYGALTMYYTNNFSNPVLVNSSISGNASITGGVCQLTPNLTSQLGGLTVNQSGSNSNKYEINFKLTATPNGLADGISYNFAPDANAAAAVPNAEQGTGTKLRIGFDSYGAANPNLNGIYLMYNMPNTQVDLYGVGNPVGVLAYSNNLSWINAPNTQVNISIDSLSRVTLVVGGTTIFSNVQLPADFGNSDKSTWKHVFKARTGGVAGLWAIDDLEIKQASILAGYTTYQNILNATTNFYVSEMGTNGCASHRTLVTAAVGNPIVTASPNNSTVCQYSNVTLIGGGAGPGATYNWSGGITDGTPFQALATTVYTVTGITAGGCSATATALVTVNPAPIGTASVSPDTICLGEAAIFSGNVPTICSGDTVHNFAGYYAPGNWTLTQNNSNGVVNPVSPTTITISSGTNGSGLPGSTEVSIPINCAGVVSFNWTYTHADAFGSLFDYPQYAINSNPDSLFTNFIQGGSNSQSGIQNLYVNAGDTIHIKIVTIDNDLTPCNMTFTNFSAPKPPTSGSVSFWDAPVGGNNLGAPPIAVTPATPGVITYYAEYTANGTGCVNPVRDTVELVTHALPTVTASPTSQDVCENGMATVAGGGAATYAWTGGITDNTPFVVTGSNTYTVTGTDANGCSNTATAVVNMNTNP